MLRDLGKGEDIPQPVAHCVTTKELSDIPANTQFDLMAIVIEVGAVQTFTFRDGEVRTKQDVRIVDEST